MSQISILTIDFGSNGRVDRVESKIHFFFPLLETDDLKLLSSSTSAG
jgi:hypothetical protein